MTYCSGKSKGKILFKDNGENKEVIVPVAPFSVSCRPSGDCGISGTRQITYIATNLSGNRTSSISSFKNETFFFKAVPQAGAYDGNRYELWGNCHGIERLIESQFSIGSGSISITENIFVADASSTGLIVTDANNAILFKIPVKECNYQISCDDDCPEGSHKCIHNKYPGYCCIPCKEVADRINNIAKKIK